jgi:hypothetical protein
VLKQQKPVVQQLVDRRTGDDSRIPHMENALPRVVKG